MKIGIDLGGSHIAIGVVNDLGIIIEKVEKRILKHDKQQICSIIEDYIVEHVNKYAKQYKIDSVGIAIPGTVDKKSIVKSVNLGIENYNIVDRLSSFNIKVKIKNDAKCAALAEHEYGSLKKYSRSLFITLGTGIGGAVIINNKLLDTGILPGMEIGHMVIKKDGLKCNCGNKGCFEKYASMKSFKDSIRKELNLDSTTKGEDLVEILKKYYKKSSNNKTIDSLTKLKNKNKNETLEKIVNEYIENLCIGLANLVNIFEPEAIIIGGSFVYFEDILLDKLKKSLKEGPYLFNKRQDLVIKTTALGNDAGIIGASLI